MRLPWGRHHEEKTRRNPECFKKVNYSSLTPKFNEEKTRRNPECFKKVNYSSLTPKSIGFKKYNDPNEGREPASVPLDLNG